MRLPLTLLLLFGALSAPLRVSGSAQARAASLEGGDPHGQVLRARNDMLRHARARKRAQAGMTPGQPARALEEQFKLDPLSGLLNMAPADLGPASAPALAERDDGGGLPRIVPAFVANLTGTGRYQGPKDRGDAASAGPDMRDTLGRFAKGLQSIIGAQAQQPPTTGVSNAAGKNASAAPVKAQQGAQYDYAALANLFIGTEANDNPGNVFPGASVPFGMVKVGIDLDLGYAPAGYNSDLTLPVRGVSPLHDSGTGAAGGSYGNFETMPVVCAGGDFEKCPTTLDARGRLRLGGKDRAEPGYFSATLNNSIQMEMTSTRRAGLQRYTFPASLLQSSGSKPFLVQDSNNDLIGSFSGGHINFDIPNGRLVVDGTWRSSFGVPIYTYNAYACYDLTNGGQQVLGDAGIWEGDRFGQDRKLRGVGTATFERNLIGGQPIQAGALFSFSKYPTDKDGNAVITTRFGISFKSAKQACANMHEELDGGKATFEQVQKASYDQWNVKLNRLQIDVANTDKNITMNLYSSMYRQFLEPTNATYESVGFDTDKPFFACLYCSWDTFRTFYPLLALHSADDYASIVENYVDGWRKTGYIPECRANGVPGITQSGSDGTNIIADFAVKYGPSGPAQKLGVSLEDIHKALLSDAFHGPPEWNSFGRQINVWRQYKYIPFGVYDRETTGRQTREASRTLEYAYNDFAGRQVALLVGDKNNEPTLRDSSLWYRNTFDPSVESFGFKGFVQKRNPNGTFVYTDPTTCSPIDNNQDHACSLQQANIWGTYESSSWEYSFFAPHDTAGIIELTAGGDCDAFAKRLDTFFAKNLFYAGNEPSFQTPVGYHYCGFPTRSVKRIRQVYYQFFNGQIPGNDDGGAMATLAIFHLLGLYPVPSTREYLLLSPFLPTYTMINSELGSFTVNVTNFDPATVAPEIPDGARAYVKTVTIDGVVQSSRCKIMFQQLLPGGGKHTNIELEMTADAASVDSCGPNKTDLPSSLSTGGFDKI